MITIQGKGVSKGIAKGPLYFFQRSDTTVTLKVVSDIEAEKARLAVAQGQSIRQLNALAEQCQEDAGEEMAVLFETHAMFVEDEDFVECITSLIDEESCNAEYAVEQAGIQFAAMFGSPEDVAAVLANDGQGIGLFRSEFLYLSASDYPTEDEQFEAYRSVAAAMNGKRVVIRTLDIGADKQVDYFDMKKEENPALGVRAIRICLNRPEVFRTQLRALYRASVYGKIAIMFPMITSVWEVKECKRACVSVMKELEAEGIPYDKDTELGIMIETPSSVFVAEELAKLVDFFSVGTNDLTQYTLACDRQANDLGKFYDPHHPALLRAIKMAADAAHKAGIWIGICGELGADISMLPTFLAMGIDELSVSPSAVLPVRAAIRQSIAQTCTLEMLEC